MCVFALGNGFRRAALISSAEGGSLFFVSCNPLDGCLVEPRQILPKDDLNAQLFEDEATIPAIGGDPEDR